MRLLELRAENIGKLKLFEITTDGENVVIGGKNGAGKSTVMKAVEMLFEGKRSFPEVPVRVGETEGTIVGKLEGGFVVERKVSADGGTALTVKSEDGAKYSSPQTLLDGFRGANTLDPLRFTQLQPKEQAEQLRRLVGIDTTKLDADRAKVYAARTEINRDVARAEAELKLVQFHKDAPVEEVSTEELQAKIADVNALMKEFDYKASEVNRLQADILAVAREIAELEERNANAEEWLAKNQSWLDSHTRPSSDDIMAALAEAQAINEKVRANREHTERQKRLIKATLESKQATDTLTKLDAEKTKTLSEAKFPVPGLGFNESGVTLNGLPFEQASQAEKLRVSTAMAFAANPKLKVVLIRDGSLLDDDNLKLVCETAKEFGGHVWIERVGEGEECSVVLEDGQVKKVRTK